MFCRYSGLRFVTLCCWRWHTILLHEGVITALRLFTLMAPAAQSALSYALAFVTLLLNGYLLRRYIGATRAAAMAMILARYARAR